jgi:hypothetical protein
MEAHVKDYANLSCDIKTYLKRYYVGHYNPRGNLFTTMALKGSVMDMLDPKPAPRQAPSWEKAD